MKLLYILGITGVVIFGGIVLPMLKTSKESPAMNQAAPQAKSATPPKTSEIVQSGGIAIRGLWVKPHLKEQTVTAGYFTLDNTNDDPRKLVEVIASPRIGRIELHDHLHGEDGMMQMRQMDAFEIDAGGTLMLAPSGKHLMLFDATTPLAEGETLALTLIFSDGQVIEVEAPVRKEAP